MFEKSYFSDKSYVLQKLDLISTNGSGVNIYAQMVELSIFEDIYNSTISGEVTLSDAVDFFATVPLSGFEFISIGIGKPGSERELVFDKVFRVYKMTSGGIKPATTSTHVYTLHFCSEENLLSSSRRVSKSYRGKTSSQIVRDILTNQLGVSSTKLEGSFIEDTEGRQNLIIPYLNPLTAISWVASRTVSTGTKGSSANYMFYENTFGYNFVSLDTLFEQETKAKYSYNVKNKDFPDDTPIDDIRDVIKYEFMNTFDVLNATINGMFSSMLRGVDLTRLQVNSSVFNYKEFFNNATHLQNEYAEDQTSPYSFQNEYSDRFDNKVYNNYFASMKMYPTNKGHDTDSNISKKQSGINQNLVESWLLQRVSQINQLNYFKLKLVIPGDTYITVGDVIEFSLPLGTGDDPGGQNINPYYSGRYLITAIRHKLNYESYEMIVEATKDCLSEEYPDALSGDSLIDEVKNR